jgi:putative colanic acid biosynthesis UDP-glucose lipid carrier transferase
VSQVGFIRTHQSTIDVIQRFSDAGLLVGTLWLSVWLSGYQWAEREEVAALAGVLVFYFLAEMNGLYASWRSTSFSSELRCLIWTLFWMVLILLLFAFVGKVSEAYSRQVMLTWFVLAVLGIGLWRESIRFILRNLRYFGFNTRRVAIVGANDLGKKLAHTIRTHPWMGFSIVGFYDDKLKPGTSFDSVEVLGNLQALMEDRKKGRIDCVYITLPMKAEAQIRELLSKLADSAIIVYLVPDLFVFELLHSRLQDVGGLPVVSIYGTPLVGMSALLKRVEDIILSLLILVIIAVPMIFIALGVKLSSPGPILFKQRRYGLGGENIWVWKFRSMTVCEDDEKMRQATRNDKRVTPFGRFLRRTSLDELPQFINVLQGQMSVVGPRPHAIIHNEQYRHLIHGYMLRHVVKPGITGWAQINGFRGETDTLEKMKNRIDYDLFYIENWSLWLDVKIVFLTIFKGFVGKNAY